MVVEQKRTAGKRGQIKPKLRREKNKKKLKVLRNKSSRRETKKERE